MCSAAFLLANQLHKPPAGKWEPSLPQENNSALMPALQATATALIYPTVCWLFVLPCPGGGFRAALNTLWCLWHSKQMRTANLYCQVDLPSPAAPPHRPTTHKAGEAEPQSWTGPVRSDDAARLLGFPFLNKALTVPHSFCSWTTMGQMEGGEGRHGVNHLRWLGFTNMWQVWWWVNKRKQRILICSLNSSVKLSEDPEQRQWRRLLLSLLPSARLLQLIAVIVTINLQK